MGNLAIAAPKDKSQPPFPVIGSEYRLTIAKRDYEDVDDYQSPGEPFDTPNPQVRFLEWLGGSWYQIAYAHPSGYILTTNLNVDQILTLTDSHLWIEKKLKAQQAEEADVDPDSVKFVGQVGEPGVVSMRDGQNSIDFLAALEACGGFKSIADKRSVVVKRRTSNGTSVFNVNAIALSRGRHTGGKLMLEAGDVVLVSQRFFD
ncbi:MAG: hypothetical protein ACKVHP_16790 [Verrucomicrobiales bacterium]